MNVQGISPMITAPVLGQSASKATAADSSTSSSSGSSSSSLSSSSLETTFLNLLVTELQNQDPTQPVDPTEMVSQMVSLNQLDQLISINQTLQNMSGTGSTSAAGGDTSQAVRPGTTNTAQPSATASAAALPTNAQFPMTSYGAAGNTGIMNLYGSFGLPGATANSMYTGVR